MIPFSGDMKTPPTPENSSRSRRDFLSRLVKSARTALGAAVVGLILGLLVLVASGGRLGNQTPDPLFFSGSFSVGQHDVLEHSAGAIGQPVAPIVRPVVQERYYCSECNGEVTWEAKACPHCGVGFGSNHSIMTREKSEKMVVAAILVITVLFGLVMVGGAIALITKLTKKQRPTGTYTQWTGGTGGGVPTMASSSGLYQKEQKKRWGHAQVPKTISGATEADQVNIGYAQGIARPAAPQGQRPTGVPGGYPQGRPPAQSGQPRPGQPRPGQPGVGIPAGHPNNRPQPPGANRR